MQIVLFFIFGLIIGSFLNVVIARYATLETILGRSFCRSCRHKIRWYDNIPLVSFILLFGRCRDCREPISWQYPAVEVGTALLFAFAGAVFFNMRDVTTWIETVLVLGVISASMVVFVYDIKRMEIPMMVLLAGIAWVVLLSMYIDAVLFDPKVMRSVFDLRLYEGSVAGGGAFLFFFLLSIFSKERWMGMGDAYIALFMGLVLGFPGILFALTLAFSLGAVVSFVLMGFYGFSMKSRVPFAPFLLTGMILFLFIEKLFPYWQYMFF